jgi:hypothetical protein
LIPPIPPYERLRFNDAIEVRAEALRLTSKRLGTRDYATFNRLQALAQVYQEAGHLDDSLRSWKELLTRKRLAEPNDLGVGYACEEVADLMEKKGDYDGALSLWGEALSNERGRNEDSAVGVRDSLARCQMKLGKFTDAESVLRECLAIRESKDRDDPDTLNTRLLLGSALLGQKKYAAAEQLLVAVGRMLQAREVGSMNKRGDAEALTLFIRLYEEWGKKDKADEWRRKLQDATKPRPETKP